MTRMKTTKTVVHSRPSASMLLDTTPRKRFSIFVDKRADENGAEPVAAPDGGRITVFRGVTSRRRPPRVSSVVRRRVYRDGPAGGDGGCSCCVVRRPCLQRGPGVPGRVRVGTGGGGGAEQGAAGGRAGGLQRGGHRVGPPLRRPRRGDRVSRRRACAAQPVPRSWRAAPLPERGRPADHGGPILAGRVAGPVTLGLRGLRVRVPLLPQPPLPRSGASPAVELVFHKGEPHFRAK